MARTSGQQQQPLLLLPTVSSLLLLLLLPLVAHAPAAEAVGLRMALTPDPVLDAAQEVVALKTFLRSNGYTVLANAMTTFGLDTEFEASLNSTRGLTIIAPNDQAFAAFKYLEFASCEPTMDWVINQHVLPFRVDLGPDSVLLGSPTFGPVPLTVTTSPTVVFSIENGRGQTLTATNLVRANTYASNFVLVHQVSNVLRYPSGTKCSTS